MKFSRSVISTINNSPIVVANVVRDKNEDHEIIVKCCVCCCCSYEQSHVWTWKKIVAVTPLKFFGRYNEVSFLSRLSFIFYQNFDNDSNLFELRCLRWILKDFRHLLRQH